MTGLEISKLQSALINIIKCDHLSASSSGLREQSKCRDKTIILICQVLGIEQDEANELYDDYAFEEVMEE